MNSNEIHCHTEPIATATLLHSSYFDRIYSLKDHLNFHFYFFHLHLHFRRLWPDKKVYVWPNKFTHFPFVFDFELNGSGGGNIVYTTRTHKSF